MEAAHYASDWFAHTSSKADADIFDAPFVKPQKK